MDTSVLAPRLPSTEADATALPTRSPDCGVYGWLQGDGRVAADIPTLIGGLAEKLVEAGVSLDRVGVFLRTLHPRFFAQAFFWRAEDGKVEMLQSDHKLMRRDVYLNSPVHRVYQGVPGFRRRLADPDCPRDFPVIVDLAEAGITDYLVLPLPFSDGARYAVSFATRQPGGFSDQQIDRLGSLTPILSVLVEVLSVRQIASNLMDTYLGHHTGARVLNGAIQRGSRETIDAAMWYSDLRGFTAMTDDLPPDVLLDLLNDHFEHVVEPIHAHGGEVLKFLGDGLLAIYQIDHFDSETAASEAALASAREALARTAARNIEREKAKLPAIRFGVGLHLGSVSYGNIGAPDRLDFTVIGPTVNQLARIADHCRRLDRPVLTSAAFADALPHGLDSMGFHALRGVREPQELFAPVL